MWCVLYLLRFVVTTDVASVNWVIRSSLGLAIWWFVTTKWRRATTAMVLAAVVVGVPAWSASHDLDQGDYAGVAVIVEEPVHVGASRVVFSIEGKRYVSYLYSQSAGAVSRCRVGEWIRLDGIRSELSRVQHGRLASRHVVGTLTVRNVRSSCHAGSVLSRSANGVRDVLASSVVSLEADEAALLLGLVIGDDSDQPTSMVEAFRAAGLSHLTAVSGQNVAFVLAVFAPLLRRVPSRFRLGVMVAIVAWFVVLTRCEPSVVRAGVMAVVAGYGSSRGFESSGERALAITVIGALFIDPLLSTSVGFALSTAATAGLVWISPRIAEHLPGPLWFAEALGVTIGAQLAVMPVSWAVFRTFNVVGLASNLVAVPVAGFVMLCGLPVMGVCGILIGLGVPFAFEATSVAMLVLRAGVRWVWWVAVIAASL